jgi:hypothetical protein
VALAVCGVAELIVAAVISREPSQMHGWHFEFHPKSWHLGKGVLALPGPDEVLTEYSLGLFTVDHLSRPVLRALRINVPAPGVVLYNQLKECEFGKVLALTNYSLETGPASAVLLATSRGDGWIRLNQLTNVLVRK